jgi:hypothetical protein
LVLKQKVPAVWPGLFAYALYHVMTY